MITPTTVIKIPLVAPACGNLLDPLAELVSLDCAVLVNGTKPLPLFIEANVFS